MRLRKVTAAISIGAISVWSLILPANRAYAQYSLPTPDELDQLLAPVALFPDTLLAQICAASTDPQQILDVDDWLHRNPGLSGQALTDAAQQQGFDPAFIALVNFPQVLDMMAHDIDNFAAIGHAFAEDQGLVTDSVQRLRQQAYSFGVLESNQYQTVQVQSQGGAQVVVIQPTNPQVVFVPQYDPWTVFQPPSAAAVWSTSMLTFGAGIALGAWINNNTYPWGWGGWGWNWGGRRVIVHNNVWRVNNRWRSPRPTYRFRRPAFNRRVYARPPSNWRNRPNRPPSAGAGRPSGNRPNVGGRPSGNVSGNRPNLGGGRPSGSASGNRPATGGRPSGSASGNRPNTGGGPSGTVSGNRPSATRPSPPTSSANRPSNAGRPAAGSTSRPRNRPNPNAGFPRGQGNRQASSGGRSSAFGGGNNARADRAAVNRGRASAGSQQRRGGNRR